MKKIFIIGSHGIPARYGGFETFAEHLAISLARKGYDITVVNEKDNRHESPFEGIRILNSKYNKSASPLAFYRDSIRLAAGAEVVIICGSGGSLFYRRISGTFIITNIDGLEQLRRRYTSFQRIAVSFLQRLAIRKSNISVADSVAIKKYWESRLPHHSQRMHVIPYGADQCIPSDETSLIKFNVKPSGYFLVIARLVPENNIGMILDAFRHYKSNKKLLIVGNADEDYLSHLKKLADERVTFTGAIYEKAVLDCLRYHCALYLHGHSVGGTNPSLLEAMAAGCACICHDNGFNRETTDDGQEYFKESFDLAIHLNSLDHNPQRVIQLKAKSIERAQFYSWNRLTGEYLALIESYGK